MGKKGQTLNKPGLEKKAEEVVGAMDTTHCTVRGASRPTILPIEKPARELRDSWPKGTPDIEKKANYLINSKKNFEAKLAIFGLEKAHLATLAPNMRMKNWFSLPPAGLAGEGGGAGRVGPARSQAGHAGQHQGEGLQVIFNRHLETAAACLLSDPVWRAGAGPTSKGSVGS